MCGIAGIWTNKLEATGVVQRVAAMTRSLAHRGPDDEGVNQVAPSPSHPDSPLVVFGHRRLSILDLTSAGRIVAAL